MNAPVENLASTIAAVAGRDPAEAAIMLHAMADQLVAGDEGPVEPCHFRFGGRVERLKPSAFLLLQYVWQRRHRTTQIDFATAEVWGPSPAPHALRGALANINLGMTATGYPQRVRQRGKFLIFE